MDALVGWLVPQGPAGAAGPVGPAAATRAAAVVLLYVFLFRLFWLLRRDLDQSRRGALALLTVIEAPESASPDEAGLMVGQTFELASPSTMGRATGNTLVVPAETASLSHLRLVYRNGGWLVEDLGSTNGTSVNGVPVTGVARLSSGDVLGCGPQVRFRLHAT